LRLRRVIINDGAAIELRCARNREASRLRRVVLDGPGDWSFEQIRGRTDLRYHGFFGSGKGGQVRDPRTSNRLPVFQPPFRDQNLNGLCEQGEPLVHATLELIHFFSHPGHFR
jgi:hypothetical protein